MWRAKSFMYGLQDDDKEGMCILETICSELQAILINSNIERLTWNWFPLTDNHNFQIKISTRI